MKRQENIIYGLVMNLVVIAGLILLLSPFFAPWLAMLIYLGSLTGTHFILVKILGKDCLEKPVWEKEGYLSMTEWLKESNSMKAKLTRFNFKILIPVFIIILIIVGLRPL